MTATAAAAAKVAANPPWSSSHAVSVARHAIRKITASSMVRGVIFGPILLGLTPHGGRRRVLELEPIGRVAGAASVSAPRCIGCKRVIRITGVHEIGTRVAQQLFDFLDRFTNHAARLSGLNLAF